MRSFPFWKKNNSAPAPARISSPSVALPIEESLDKDIVPSASTESRKRLQDVLDTSYISGLKFWKYPAIALGLIILGVIGVEMLNTKSPVRPVSNSSGLNSALSGKTPDNKSSLHINLDTIIEGGKQFKSSGQFILQNDQDSQTTFLIQNAAGDVLLGANTLNGQININGQLEVSGDISSGGRLLSGGGSSLGSEGLRINNVLVCDTTGCIPSPSATGAIDLNNLNASNITSGTLADSRLSGFVTLQGNVFNGPSQLLKLDATGKLSPGLVDGSFAGLNADQTFTGANTFNNASNSFTGNGSGLTNVNAATLNGQNSAYYTSATNISSGTLANARLTASVTLQGNSFNGVSQLVQLTAGGLLPVLNGSNLTNVNAATLNGQNSAYYTNGSNISSGTISDARLSSNVGLLNANQIFIGVNTFSNSSNSFTGNGSGLTNVDAATLGGQAASYFTNADNISSGTLSDTRLSSNVAFLAGNQTFTGNNIFQLASASFSVQDAATPLGLSLFEVTDSTGTTAYFSVDDAGAYVNGNEICTVAGNCAGVGGQVGGSGSVGTIALFTAGSSIGDSILTESGGAVTAGGNFNVTGQYQVGGSQISSSNLSNDANLAKVDGNTTFTGNNIFSSALNSFTGNGSGLTNVDAATLGGQAASYFTNADNISSGTLSDLRLSANVTLQGNTFNSINQLVKLDGSGNLPALNASALTNLNADNISSGTVADVRLSSNVALRDANNTFTGSNLFQNATNSTTAFQVQNAAGTDVIFNVDTVNKYVGIGTDTPLLPLHILNTSAKIRLDNSTLTFDIGTTGNGGTITSNTAGKNIYLTATSGSFNFSTNGATNDSFLLNADGTARFRNNADSTTAFQIQSASGSDTLFTANTLTRTVGVSGNILKVGDSTGTDTNTTILVLDSTTANPTTNLTSLNGGLFYNSTTNKVSIVENGTIKVLCNQTDASCGGNSTTLQQAYDASTVSPQITLNSSPGAGGLTIQDNATPLGTNLFTVQSNACAAAACRYLSTNATGVSVTNLSVVASGSISIAGGNTASRPASPTAGMIYYDTSTNQMLQYNGTKWVSDRSTATKIVAASNSPQAAKDAADYVADGTDDQVEINSALTAASGGIVYLMEGTYITHQTASGDATIKIPNNTTLAGAGRGTLIELGDLDVTDNLIENSDTATGTGVVIRDLRLDGRSDLNTAGTQHGIYFNGMGSGTGAGALQGAKVSSISILRFRSSGIRLASSSNNTIMAITAQNNTDYGIDLASGSYNTVSSNNAQGNGLYGIRLFSSNQTVTGNTVEGNGSGIAIFSSNNIITGNTLQLNSSNGIALSSASNNSISGNTVQGSGSRGIYMLSSSNNLIISNKVHNSSGSTANDGIYLDSSDFNSIIGNHITDTACTGTCYAINILNSLSDKNHLEGNRFSGSSANAASINDVGTGTIYANQQTNTTTSSNSDVSDFRFRGSANSSTAFQVQNASGSSLFSVDTSTSTLNSVGFVSLQPAANLTSGQTHITQTLTNASSTGGVVKGLNQSITVANTVSASTTYGIDLTITDNTTLGNTNQGIHVLVNGSNTNQSGYGIDSISQRGVGVRGISQGASSVNCGVGVAGGIGVCGYAQTGTNLGYGGYFMLTSGSSSSSALYASNGTTTGKILQLQDNATDVFTVSDNGAVLAKNSTDSSTAFQIQTASAADTLFTVNTNTRTAGVAGNTIKVGNDTGSDTNVTILVVDSTNTAGIPSTNLASLNGGLFYNSQTHKLSIIENGTVKVLCNQTDASCGGNSTTLQQAYDASTGGTTPEIVLGATRTTFDIQDRSTSNGGSLGTNLLSVRATAANDTTLGSTLFGVSSTGQVLAQNSANSTTAFAIQNSAGTSNLFVADTTNTRLGVGTAAPSQLLHLASSLTDNRNTAVRLQTGSNSTNQSVGPTYPTNSSSDSSNAGETVWASPSNANADDGVYTVASIDVFNGTSSDDTQYLLSKGFGFSIPANAIIHGVKAEIERTTTGTTELENSVRLVKNNVVVGSNYARTDYIHLTNPTQIYGGYTDLWGTTWSAADINNANFGIVYSAQTFGAVNVNISVDFMRLTVYYSLGTDWTLGSDLSGSGSFKISSASALGTNDHFSISAYTGAVTLKNGLNSVSAFSVQNQAGATLFGVDTVNSKIFSSSNLGFTFTTSNTIDSGYLLTVQNNGSDRFYIDADGNVTAIGDYRVSSGKDVALQGIGNTRNALTKRFTCTAITAAGYVVVIDTANAGQVTTTTTANSALVAGVVTSGAVGGQTCTVAIGGVVQVTATTAAVSIGDRLVTSATTGQVQTNNTPSVGTVVGKALSAKSAGSSGSVWVLITHN